MAGFGSRAKWCAWAALTTLVVTTAGCGQSDEAAHGAAPAKAAAGKAGAPNPLVKPLWQDLTPAQQVALAPLQSEWDKLTGMRKKKWLDIASRYASMKPEEQDRMHERMEEWVKLTPEQRSQARRNFARAQKLDPSQKSAQWEEYQQLPDEQKKELADKAATVSKKQVVNLPTPAQSKIKTVEPIKHPHAVTAPAPLAIPAPAAAPAGGVPATPATPGAATGTASASDAAAAAASASASMPNATNVTPAPPASSAPPSNVK